MKRIWLVFSIGASACSTLPKPEIPSSLALRSLPTAVVVIVKVKPPWYAPHGAIVRKFRQLVPQYQAAAGLERKQFSFAANGHYGGVYLWTERATAEHWFGPAWHERVRKERGVEGDVRVVSVTRGLDAPTPTGAFEGPMVVAIAPDGLDR